MFILHYFIFNCHVVTTGTVKRRRKPPIVLAYVPVATVWCTHFCT